MSELIYSPREDGQVRLSDAHLGAIGVIHLSGFDGAAEQVGSELVGDLVTLGIVDQRGELDTPMVLLAETIANPERAITVRAIEGGRTQLVQGFASLHSLVLIARVPDADGLVDIDLEPSVDVPLAIARLVDLGPRPIGEPGSVSSHALSADDLERAFSGAPDDAARTTWPELAAVPVERRRLWMVHSTPVRTNGGGAGFELAVADLGDGGLWLVGRPEGDGRGDLEAERVSATKVWAALTLLLRDLFSDGS
jgi:hypothetical protein